MNADCYRYRLALSAGKPIAPFMLTRASAGLIPHAVTPLRRVGRR
ncbi:hypothetical protein FHR20_001553 [Sphingomonas leidyi]|uniref:Uncharacterized protein n=1 Tax=Sphingomonas leidyi TaxID=68569 RepID=A0A7X5UZT9_9SPHN|nr:hypothetical protein [Sphingomonas leidyi]